MPKSVFSEAYASLLAVLIEARKEAGLSQAQLASALGRPQPFISYVERGERRVDVIEFCAIARALGCDPESLFRKVVLQLPDALPI